MRISIFLFTLLLYFLGFSHVLAIVDPLATPNNKIGLHLLFPSELSDASKIVNAQGKSAWGYVTIPIQASDKNRSKWQDFFDKCKAEKIIPIVRLATVPDGDHWVEPNDFDLVDFANFLNDLKWPTQNRYLIIFNEVNRADEYSGVVSPEKYADILNTAIDIFKERSDDFFILPAGLDNAATDRRNSVNWKVFLQRMFLRQPDIFNKIDGWTSHAYPNPDFSARPDLSGTNKIDSFKYDLMAIKNYTNKKLPIFITETGWSNRYLAEHQIALYYRYALEKVWSDPQIVAITPFLLNAQDGPFKQFSFMSSDNRVVESGNILSSFAQTGSQVLPSEDFVEDVLVGRIKDSTVAAPHTRENIYASILKNLYNNLKLLIDLIQ